MADTAKHDQQALEPENKTYKVKGKKYTLNPPKMKHLGRVMWMSGLFTKAQNGERVSDADMDEAEAGLDSTINELTVEDVNASGFTLAEKMEILGSISEMIGTADQRAMAEQQMIRTGKAAASGSPS